MYRNPPEGMSGITPYLFYKDVAAAVKWLEKKFGFQEKMTVPGPNGDIIHAEMLLEKSIITMGADK